MVVGILYEKASGGSQVGLTSDGDPWSFIGEHDVSSDVYDFILGLKAVKSGFYVLFREYIDQFFSCFNREMDWVNIT